VASIRRKRYTSDYAGSDKLRTRKNILMLQIGNKFFLHKWLPTPPRSTERAQAHSLLCGILNTDQSTTQGILSAWMFLSCFVGDDDEDDDGVVGTVSEGPIEPSQRPQQVRPRPGPHARHQHQRSGCSVARVKYVSLICRSHMIAITLLQCNRNTREKKPRLCPSAWAYQTS